MSAYIYRLSGKDKFTVVEIDGKPERVYHLVYWWKPGYDFGGNDWARPKNHAALYARLENSFADLPVKFVTTCSYGKPIDHIMEPNAKYMSYWDSSFGGNSMPLVLTERIGRVIMLA